LYDQVARRADIALYVAKTQGRDRVEVFNPLRHGNVSANASQRR
jgi:predicted signal transduction protein with EAL and GGDEF domain